MTQRWGPKLPRGHRRQIVAPPKTAIAAGRTTVVDRAPGALLFACALLLSAGAHLIGGKAISGLRRAQASLPRKVETLKVAVIEKPLPPPPEPPQAELPRPVPVERQRRKLALTHEPPPPVPVVAPPPPNQEAPVDKAVPQIVTGLSLSSTTTAGAFKVAVGNTLYGERTAKTNPEDAKPYKAKEYAAPYALTEEPVFLNNVSPEQVRRFYPEDARKAKIETAVRTRLVVDDDGTVVKVTVLADPGNGFAAAATKLARQYRFKPARVNGRTVATEIPFTIHFELD